MAGMLSRAQGEEQPAQQPPSSGPAAETPPAGASPTNSSPGPEHSAPQQQTTVDYKTLRDQALQLVYGDRMNELAGMFIESGADGFPQAMSTAVNTAITELEKTHGPLGHEMAAQIGMALYIRLLEDFVGEGIVKGVTPDHMQDALPAILMGYQKTHPDVTMEDLQAVMLHAGKLVDETGGEPMDVPGIDVPLPEGQSMGQAVNDMVAQRKREAPPETNQAAPGGPV